MDIDTYYIYTFMYKSCFVPDARIVHTYNIGRQQNNQTLTTCQKLKANMIIIDWKGHIFGTENGQNGWYSERWKELGSQHACCNSKKNKAMYFCVQINLCPIFIYLFIFCLLLYIIQILEFMIKRISYENLKVARHSNNRQFASLVLLTHTTSTSNYSST